MNTRSIRAVAWAFAIVVLAAGCDEGATGASDAAGDGTVADASFERAADAGVDVRGSDGAADGLHGDAGPPKCPPQTTRCGDESTQERCTKQADGSYGWVAETCGAQELCLGLACSSACADECDHGATRKVGGATQTCQLFKVADKSYGPLPQPGLHHRARRHNAQIRAEHLPGGTIADTYYQTAALQKPIAYHGVGDSAIWTGSYLAAEALRAEVTNAADARANVERLVESIHQLFEVNGHVGYLSRYTAPMDHPDPLVLAQYKPGEQRHHQVSFKGKDWFWLGSTSRDQYQGVVLGYAWAYEALPAGKHRDMIRADVVAICEELMKEHKGITVNVRFHAFGSWQTLPVKLDMTHVILNPTEYKNGAPYIQIGDDNNPADIENGSVMAGFREFWPDYQSVITQIPILGSLLNFPIPRSGSAIMLAAVMRLGIRVTEGVPSAAATHAKLEAYYAKHIAGWLAKMKAYVNLNDANACWRKYYGMNIVWQPMWTLARLETDPTIRKTIIDDVMAARMWPYVKDHKNVFFSYIYASQQAQSAATQQVVTAASTQLAQFQEPPKIQRAVDNTAAYAEDPKCPGQTKVATDVAHRAASDFNWQRNPFKRVDPGDPRKVYPGIDYVLAYWMSRYYGWTADDSAGSCLRWK
jgi:hypothetical protein